MKIIWTKSAVSSLENIKNYIALESEYYAIDLIEKIISAVEKLSNFPRLGRQVAEAKSEDVREIIYGSYRIIYKSDKDTVYILAIIHGARNINNLNPRPWEIV